jgi:hypothetical protein
MIRFFILSMTVFLWLGPSARSQGPVPVDTSRRSVEYWQHWLADLTTHGVEKKKDSFFVREEVVRLLRDSQYRQSVYPAVYTWPAVTSLLDRMELKTAFWHLINLYDSDTARRQLVLGTVALYDSVIDMDKVLLSTYYTYAFADPRVCRLAGGKPDIYRPDLLEKTLRTTREIIGYLWMYRKEKQKKNS